MSRGAAGLSLVLALALAACGGAAGPVGTLTTGGNATATAGAAAATPAVPASPAPTAMALSPLKLLWQKGGPTTVATETYWPAINPITKDIWVASGFQNEYWIFKPDGTYVGSWGTGGSGPGQLALTTHDVHPDGVGAIAFAPDGTFYVADVGNYRVQKFDRNGKFVTMWGSFGSGDGQFGQPKGIVTDGKTVYVADDPRGDMQAFDSNGKFLRGFAFPSLWPYLVSPNLIYTGSGGSIPPSIVEWDASGKTVGTIALDPAALDGGDVFAVRPDGAGNLIVMIRGRLDATSDQDSEILKVDMQGHVLGRWAAAGETMTLSPDGKSLYTAYTGENNTGWPYIRKYALP